jgi:hypothetical protein
VLNDLFGIEAPPSGKRDLSARTSAEVVVTEAGAAWGLRATDLSGLEAVETSVGASVGTSLLKVGEADAVIVRRVGEGWGIYLNLLLDHYPNERADGYRGGAVRALLGRLLERMGVAAPVRVTTPGGAPAGRALFSRYRFGESEVVAVLLEPSDVTAREGVDGVTTYEDAGLGAVARHPLVVRLPRAAHVANARTGESLGVTDTVQVSVRLGSALVLGLDTEPGRVTVSGPVEARRGDQLSFVVTASGPGRRLVRAHVFGPDGAFLHEYARNLVLEDGDGMFVLPSALNDAAGRYRIALTDVLSGASAETALELR